jgi:hypothetical protein
MTASDIAKKRRHALGPAFADDDKELEIYRGSSLEPIKNSSTPRAH